MKQLVIVNGTMGVGKTAVCRELLKLLTPGVWLDGDWCWNMNPFVVSEENKVMVLSNITHLLRTFLTNSGYEYVVFCWVIHDEALFEQILQPLSGLPFELHKITLLCTEDALRMRLLRDVQSGVRRQDVIERSVMRLPLYRDIWIPLRWMSAVSRSPRPRGVSPVWSVGIVDESASLCYHDKVSKL